MSSGFSIEDFIADLECSVIVPVAALFVLLELDQETEKFCCSDFFTDQVARLKSDSSASEFLSSGRNHSVWDGCRECSG